VIVDRKAAVADDGRWYQAERSSSSFCAFGSLFQRIPVPKSRVFFVCIIAACRRLPAANASRAPVCPATSPRAAVRPAAPPPEFADDVWGAALRALDDSRDEVQVGAWQLGAALTALSARLCDRLHAPRVADADAAAASLLPALLRRGTSEGGAESRMLALSALTRVSRACGAAQLRPWLAQLLPVLVEARLFFLFCSR
jgi:hypothetical protein